MKEKKQPDKYVERQRKIQVKKLLYTHSSLFNEDKGGGDFYKSKKRIYILKDGINNLFYPIQESVLNYFSCNNIQWWGDNEKYPSGHLLSSQIHCINHLYSIRKDKTALIAILLKAGIQVDNLLHPEGEDSFIQLEATSQDPDLINEKSNTRGKYCTSIDALLLAKYQNKKILILIEWKYTESYVGEECFKGLNCTDGKGEERHRRYDGLIKDSSFIAHDEALNNETCYHEPFYQLMRQTLWAEQSIRKLSVADDYIHLHMIPPANKELLETLYPYSNLNMKNTWKSCLTQTGAARYRITDPAFIVDTLKDFPEHSELCRYLKERYY